MLLSQLFFQASLPSSDNSLVRGTERMHTLCGILRLSHTRPEKKFLDVGGCVSLETRVRSQCNFVSPLSLPSLAELPVTVWRSACFGPLLLFVPCCSLLINDRKDALSNCIRMGGDCLHELSGYSRLSFSWATSLEELAWPLISNGRMGRKKIAELSKMSTRWTATYG